MKKVSEPIRRHNTRTALKRLIRAVLRSLALAIPLSQAWMPAQAATSNSSFAVTMTVQATCTVSAATLAFGAFTGVTINATTTLAVTCTNTTPYQIGADNGQHSAYIGVYAKYMIGPSSNQLRYHLFTDAAHSIEWGTTAGTNEVAGTGTGAAQTITVYGAVNGGSLAYIPGSYSDTVTFTVTF